jgi:exodeoxyribonuclease V beta subunit
VGQLLHAAASAEHLGSTALGGWLRRRIAEATRDSADEDRTRRLESDAEAVQVLTIHRSKGLEFPIVYLPYLWDNAWISDTPEPVAFHDPECDDRRTLDVTLEGAGYAEHRQRAIAEQRGEDLRLAYVGLTRARHQAVVWWAGTRYTGQAPLSRLVFDRQADGTVPAHGSTTRSDDAAHSAFEAVAAQAPGCVSVEVAGPPVASRWAPGAPSTQALEVARFGRSLDRRWRRTSYTDMTAGTHEPPVGSEPEEPTLRDEPDAPEGDRLDGSAVPDALPSLLRELPVGVAAGTLVHQALEMADFAAEDLADELARALETAPGRRSVAISSLPAVVGGLQAALMTPLGPLAGGLRLADIARGSRVDELGFELPLAGGEHPRDGVAVTPARIARVLEARVAADDPMLSYSTRLGDPMLRQSVRGYLTGSLDLVARIAGERFLIADYKTNWLAQPDAPLSTWHYRPDALVEEMNDRHYGLQALLYLVALHRYLRWRLPGYDPDRHIAGVVYLFLRGMAGPETPVIAGAPCGVFAWAPPPGLVAVLSDVLDGSATT